MPTNKFLGEGEPWVVRAADIDQMRKRAVLAILWATREQLSYYSSLDTMLGTFLGVADSSFYSVNVGKDLWLTPTRWSTLCNQYVDPDKLFKFLEGVKTISTYNRGNAALDFNPVAHVIVESNARANRRKWGGCLRMMTYRAYPKPTLTLFSRTSYIDYIGGLDLLLAHKIAELAADMIGDGLTVNDIAFRWSCDTIQAHGFKGLATYFSYGYDKLFRSQSWPQGRKIKHPLTGESHTILPVEAYPTWALLRSWWARINRQDDEGKMYSEMKYGAEIRIRRRYHAQVTGDTSYTDDKFKAQPVLDTPIELITLDRMLYKTPESRAIIRKKKQETAAKLVKDLFEDEEDASIIIGTGRKGEKFTVVKDMDELLAQMEAI